MTQSILKGATSQSVYVFIRDSSATTGVGLTGLVYNSAGLVASYVRPVGSRTAITLATQTVTGAYSSGGFIEVDATNMPGVYRLDVPNAAIASGVDVVYLMLRGATNMEPCLKEIPLTAVNLQDSVRMGLTALPNATAAASGGLLISGSNAGTTTLAALTITGATTHTGATTYTGAVTASNASNNFRVNGLVPGAAGGLFIAGTNAATAVTTSFTTTFTGNLTGSVASVTGSVGSVTGAVGSVTGNVGGNVTGSVGTVLALAADSVSASALASDAVTEIQSGLASQASVDNLPTSAELATALGTADDAVLAVLGSPAGASLAADIAAVKVDTADIRVTTDKLDNTLELTSDGYIFTVNGLQNAPSGTGASPSAIADEVQTRTIAAVTVVNGLAANVITAAATAADFTTEIQAGIATAAALATVDTVVDAIQAKTDALPTDPADQSLIIAATNALAALLGTPAGASVSADVAAVKADTASILTDTAEIGTAGAGLTVLATAAALATVDTNVDSILADTGTDGVVVAAASKTGYQLSATGVDDILDEVVEGAVTLRQSVRLANSALGGKASGLATTEATFRDLGDTKDRLVATVDADGNRSAVTRDLT